VLRAVARGHLPDSCTRIYAERRDRRGRRIQVILETRRESGARCVDGPQPFSRSIVVSTLELHPGLYTLEVNGVSELFDLPATRELRPDAPNDPHGFD